MKLTLALALSLGLLSGRCLAQTDGGEAPAPGTDGEGEAPTDGEGEVPVPGPEGEGGPPDGEGPPDDGGGGGGGGGISEDAPLCDVAGADFLYTEALVDDVDVPYRDIFGSGCPNHWNMCQKGYCTTYTTEARMHNSTVAIPSYPKFRPNNETIDLTCTPAALAVALNGVSIFGQTNGRTDCGDAIESEAPTFDLCGSHAEPGGEYHYHVTPPCLLDQLGDVDTAHSPQWAWTYDGFPLYGPYGPGGVSMYRCGHALADDTYCVDECNGYRGALPEVDEFLYRYYSTGPKGDMTCSYTVENSDTGVCDFGGGEDLACCTNTVPSLDVWPYILGCYVGCTYEETIRGECDDGEDAYTYTEAVAGEAVTEQHVIEGFDYATFFEDVEEEVDTTDGEATDGEATDGEEETIDEDGEAAIGENGARRQSASSVAVLAAAAVAAAAAIGFSAHA